MKTNAQRQQAFRARRAETPEVRGIFAPKELHAAIKAEVKRMLNALAARV